ncbi:MAG TPA: hypothetical protein VGM88_15590 [Kofleriaceae bacterium]|jgi:hypothetical protein
MLLRFASITTLLGSLLVAGAGLTGCTTDDTATLTVVNTYNDPDIDITELYISAVGDDTFTDNLLDEDLQNGDSITIEVTCDSYDVEVVDSDGFDCVAPDFDLCGTDDELDVDESFCTFSDRKVPMQPGSLGAHRMPKLHLKQ